MKDTDKRYCGILLDLLIAHGVQEIVLSPGSRNAPLLIGASYRDKLHKHISSDERSAAFMAMGMALASQKPVAIACTSGTALYNYAPAIAEAFYQRIPLIVITADRQQQWLEQNDSQTLLQYQSLDKIVKKSFNIPTESSNPDLDWYVNRIVNEAIILSTDGIPGPVHINIEFDNPLCNTTEIPMQREHRIIEHIKSNKFLDAITLDNIVEDIIDKKVLVIAGFMPPNESLNKALDRFAKLPNVYLLCETISNLHIDGNPYAIDIILSNLSPQEKESLRPDIVISLGGSLISGILKTFVREYSPKEVWTLDDTYFGIDCFKALTKNIDVSPQYFFDKISDKLSEEKAYLATPDEYAILWNKYKNREISKRYAFVESIEWSELKAFKYLLENIPSDYNLFLSNGTPIRYGQLFTKNIPHASYCNRGVSGIEGTSATAAGCAMAYDGPTLLITGDTSFAYFPAVMQIEGLPRNFKIVVINNKGGGIFRFIPHTRATAQREKYFCADTEVPIKGLASAYNWKYYCADCEDILANILKSFLTYPDNAILEIQADEKYSSDILREFMFDEKNRKII